MTVEIKLKRSDVAGKAPVSSDLSIGELALNTADGSLYSLVNEEVALLNPGVFSRAQVISVTDQGVGQINPYIVDVVFYNASGGTTPRFMVYFPTEPSDGQVITLTFGTDIKDLIMMSADAAIQEPLEYVRCDEEAKWVYEAATNVWRCIENPRRMFVAAEGDISTAGSSMHLDVGNIRFTLSYISSGASRGSMQTLTGTSVIDFRWVGMYNGAIDQGAYDGYTLTTTPVVYDSTIYSASNELSQNYLRFDNEIWRLHYLISGGGARTTMWAKRVY